MRGEKEKKGEEIENTKSERPSKHYGVIQRSIEIEIDR